MTFRHPENFIYWLDIVIIGGHALDVRKPLAFALLLLLCASASAGTVTRTLSSAEVEAGSDLTVTLEVRVSEGESYYGVDELIPEGWALKDAGDAATGHAGHLKWLVIQDANDSTYTYVLTAPGTQGQFSFSGNAMFEAQGSESAIGGQSTVTVTASQGQQPPLLGNVSGAGGRQVDWTLALSGLVIIALAALVLPYYMNRSKAFA